MKLFLPGTRRRSTRKSLVLFALERRLKQLSNKKRRASRHEVRVTILEDNPSVKFNVHDRVGLLAQGFCASRRDVAREATRISSLALNMPEGRIKINRVVEE